jgi:hypothetical protein
MTILLFDKAGRPCGVADTNRFDVRAASFTVRGLVGRRFEAVRLASNNPEDIEPPWGDETPAGYRRILIGFEVGQQSDLVMRERLPDVVTHLLRRVRYEQKKAVAILRTGNGEDAEADDRVIFGIGSSKRRSVLVPWLVASYYPEAPKNALELGDASFNEYRDHQTTYDLQHRVVGPCINDPATGILRAARAVLERAGCLVFIVGEAT